MSECTSDQCQTKTHASHCETGSKDCGCPITAKILEPCCPVEFSVRQTAGAFPEAMHAVTVDLLKEKIRKAWGPVMEKQAEAVVTALGAAWKAGCEQSQAALDLRSAFKKIMEDACKK